MTESQYMYIAFSRGRTLEGSKIPLRIRSTSNPGGIGHGWVKKRLIKADDNPSLNREQYTAQPRRRPIVAKALSTYGPLTGITSTVSWPPAGFSCRCGSPLEEHDVLISSEKIGDHQVITGKRTGLVCKACGVVCWKAP